MCFAEIPIIFAGFTFIYCGINTVFQEPSSAAPFFFWNEKWMTEGVGDGPKKRRTP